MASAISEIESEINGLIASINRLAAAERQLTGGQGGRYTPSKQEWNLRQNELTNTGTLNSPNGWTGAALGAALGKRGGRTANISGGSYSSAGIMAGQNLANNIFGETTSVGPPGAGFLYQPKTPITGPMVGGTRAKAIIAQLGYPDKMVLAQMKLADDIAQGKTLIPSFKERYFASIAQERPKGSIRAYHPNYTFGTNIEQIKNYRGVELYGTISPDIHFGGLNRLRRLQQDRIFEGRGQWNRRQRMANWMDSKKAQLSALSEEYGLKDKFIQRFAAVGFTIGMGKLGSQIYDAYMAPIDVEQRYVSPWDITKKFVGQAAYTGGTLFASYAATRPLQVAAAAFTNARRAGVVRNMLGRTINQFATKGTWLRAAANRTAILALAYVAGKSIQNMINEDETNIEINERMSQDVAAIKTARQSFTSIYGGDVKEAMKQYKDRVYGPGATEGYAGFTRKVLSYAGFVTSPEEIEAEALRKVRERIQKAATNHEKAMEWGAKQDFVKFSSQLAQANAEMGNLAHPAWKNPKRIYQNIQSARNAARNYGHGLYTRGRERVGD